MRLLSLSAGTRIDKEKDTQQSGMFEEEEKMCQEQRKIHFALPVIRLGLKFQQGLAPW